MYELKPTEYGLWAKVKGNMDPAEVGNLRAEFVDFLAKQNGPFSMVVDCTEFLPPERGSAALFVNCEEMALGVGLERMAIIYTSPVLRASIRQIQHLSGTVGIAKYINAAKYDNAEQIALAWAVDGFEPEAIANPIDQQSQFIPVQQ